MSQSDIGIKGEKVASSYLESLGRKIVGANYHTRFGEIDIIAVDGDTICFVEVKARKKGSLVGGAESVSVSKQRKIVLAASEWLAQNAPCSDCRFDVVEVEVTAAGITVSDVIEAAFDAE